ncbi:uncharacterized protein TRUGW13939_06984 [Talaromyces rugulosus]|uniref:Uncharacterized protein n=1 Tax=Talaromyces rugulosus TaxID=121627 RepID=A0A7H8R0G6_TALRU|nr:uncharacterized protein TRUGW13939_06984 [Talaromyces rugulosus]QKX59842.1 hypothetical protein TRUGW13939_06984 [Talaromyces rugulosus]
MTSHSDPQKDPNSRVPLAPVLHRVWATSTPYTASIQANIRSLDPRRPHVGAHHSDHTQRARYIGGPSATLLLHDLLSCSSPACRPAAQPGPRAHRNQPGQGTRSRCKYVRRHNALPNRVCAKLGALVPTGSRVAATIPMFPREHVECVERSEHTKCLEPGERRNADS